MPPADKQLIQTPAELAEALRVITAVDPAPPATPEIGDSFEEMSLGIVRRAHAMDALSNPDGSVVFEYQDARMAVVTQARTTPNGAFVLLVLVNDVPSKKGMVPGAFRLYGTEAEVAELAGDARASFQAFLERYAIPFASAGRQVLFLPVLNFPVVGGTLDIPAAFGLSMTPDAKWTVSATYRVSADQATALWPFVLDVSHYEADVKARRR